MARLIRRLARYRPFYRYPARAYGGIDDTHPGSNLLLRNATSNVLLRNALDAILLGH